MGYVVILVTRMITGNIEQECSLMVRYLLGVPADHNIKVAYTAASQKVHIHFSDKEYNLWKACLKYKWLLPYIDAYLGVSRPTHPIRRKLFTVFALLETQPGYHTFFLPSEVSRIRVLVTVITSTVSSVIKMIIGRILIWII
jgi:hypothetical protein